MFKIEHILRVHTHDEDVIGKQIQSKWFPRENKFRCLSKSTFNLIVIQFSNIRSKSSIHLDLILIESTFLLLNEFRFPDEHMLHFITFSYGIDFIDLHSERILFESK